MVITKSPSGALSPYYYKGGYFHGIHYGSFFDDTEAFYEMMAAEERFILESPQERRIMIDLYETKMSNAVILEFAAHIERIRSRIFKLAISCEKAKLRALRKALSANTSLAKGAMFFTPDMEEGKTWLVRT